MNPAARPSTPAEAADVCLFARGGVERYGMTVIDSQASGGWEEKLK